MKILLISKDSMVNKLVGASAKKLGLDISIQESLQHSNEEDVFLFIDDSIIGDIKEFIQDLKPVGSCYIQKRTSPSLEGFDFYIKKPFLPTEALDIMKTKMNDLGINENTTSNILREDLEEIKAPSESEIDLDLIDDDIEFDIEDDLTLENKNEKTKHEDSIGDLIQLDDEMAKQNDLVENIYTDLEEELDPLGARERKIMTSKDGFNLEDTKEWSNSKQNKKPKTSKKTSDEGIKLNDIGFLDKNSDLEIIPEALHNDENTQNQKYEIEDIAMDEDFEDKQESEEILDHDDFEINQEEELSTQSDDIENEENFVSTQIPIEEKQKDEHLKDLEQAIENFEIDDEPIKETTPEEQILEEETQTTILDKEQVKEIKKLLKENDDSTSDKPELFIKPNEEIASIDDIKEEEIIEILEGKMQEQSIQTDTEKSETDDKNNFSLEDFDLLKDSEQSMSGKEFLEKLNSFPVDKLKVLLDGIEVTININFPDKKK